MRNSKPSGMRKAAAPDNDATVLAKSPVPSSNDATVLAPGAGPSANDATVLASGLVRETPATNPATLLFSLGIRQGSADKLSWASELPVVQMLADLVTASKSTPGTDSEGLLSATAPGSIEAVILAVRARKLAETYSSHAMGDLSGISIAILAAPKNGDSPEPALRTYLENRTQSWQVFLAGDAFKQLDTFPGLQFRKLPAPAGPRFELHELVLPPITTPSKPAPAPAPKASSGVRPIAAPVAAVAPKDPDVPLLHRKDEDSKSGLNLKLIIGGVAAVVVVGAVLALHPWSHAAPAAAPAAAPVTTEATPAAATPTASPAPVPAKSSATQDKLDKKAQDAAARAAAYKALPNAPTPQPNSKPVAAQAAPPPPPADKPIKSSGGYTAEQLKAILDKADSLTANGKYDDAIRNYRVVLASDPGNARARAGLERANTNKSLP